jgi:hypothetical protein
VQITLNCVCDITPGESRAALATNLLYPSPRPRNAGSVKAKAVEQVTRCGLDGYRVVVIGRLPHTKNLNKFRKS